MGIGRAHPARRTLVVLSLIALALMILCVAAPVAAVVAGALVVVTMAPVGRTMTGRIAAVLLIWMAASQFAYVLAWPSSFPPRQAVAWTVAGVAVLAWRAAHWPGARLVVGRVGLPPVALLGFASVTTWWFWPWRGDATHVLDRMLMGWDSAGHFGMVEQLRSPQPAGETMFPGYPRGFHALVASLMELGSGHPNGLDSELVAYAYAALVVMGASLVLLAAYVLDSPVFARSPVLLLPALAALITVYLQFEDAAQVPYLGFGNFLEAAACVGAGVLLAVRWTRDEDAWRFFLLGCAGVGILGTWPLLLTLLVPVPVAVWLARRRYEKGCLRRLALRAMIVVVMLLAALAAQPTLFHLANTVGQGSPGQEISLLETLDHFLLIDGAITTSAPGWPVVFPLVAVMVPLGSALYARRSPAALRAAYLWIPAAVAAAMAATMLGYELVRVGGPRYYGLKVLCATMLVGGSIAVVACTQVLEQVLRRPRPRIVVGAAVLALTTVLVVCDGGPVAVGPLPASFGGKLRATTASDVPDERQFMATAVRQACAVVADRPGEYYLLVPGATHDDLVRANSWIITCSFGWNSAEHTSALRQMLPDTGSEGSIVVNIATDTRRILQAQPTSRVIVPATVRSDAVSGLTSAEQQRVVTY